jgi:hypothetical protein
MKPKNPNSDIASGYANSGKKMVVQPKKGESASKNLTVGRSSTNVQNGIYVPKPTAAAKVAAPTPVKKSNFKAPSSKQTGMGKAMKKGGKGKMC